MIKINVFNQADFDKLLLQRAVAQFAQERSDKTFAGRHPELGKMFNCAVCGRRHRGIQCAPVYAKVAMLNEDNEEVQIPLVADQRTRRGVYGAHNYRGRMLRHRNEWGLKTIELATLFYRDEMKDFPNARVDASDATPEEKKRNQEFRDKVGKSCLSRALNVLRGKRAARRRNLNAISFESCRRNRA